jgi:hypothetical protein
MSASRRTMAQVLLLCVVGCGSPPPSATAGKVGAGAHGASPSVEGGDLPASGTVHAEPGAALPEALPEAEPLEPSPAFGAATELVLEAAAADGSWVAFCQAHTDTNGDGSAGLALDARGRLTGDTPSLVLARGPHVLRQIDALLAVDPTGRFIVVREQGKTWLEDTSGSERKDLDALGADVRSDVLTHFAHSPSHPVHLHSAHRSLAFDEAGSRLAFVRKRDASGTVVVFELATARESTIELGAVDIWRIEWAPANRWLVAHVIREDSNGNGRLDWPVLEAQKDERPCGARTPTPSYEAWHERGDKPTFVLIDTLELKAYPVSGFVAPLGEGFIVREGGALLYERTDGRRRSLMNAKCGGRPYHVDQERGLMLALCVAPAPYARTPVVLVSQAEQLELAPTLIPAGPDRWRSRSQRLVPVYPGRDAALVDMDRRTVTALRSEDHVITTQGARALIRRQRSLLILDMDSGTETSLSGAVERVFDVLVQGNAAFVTPLIVDVARGQVVGKSEQRPLALAADGSVLVAERDASDGELAMGPLRWRKPQLD